MDILSWVVKFSLNSIWWKWLISWGGAQKLEGWMTFIVSDLFVTNWTSSQIQFYSKVAWVFSSIWFILGLFFPELRF